MGLGPVISLVGGIGNLSRTAIVMLSVLGVVGFVFAFVKHGWHNTSGHVQILRSVVIVFFIFGGMAALAKVCWPRAPITVDSVLTDPRSLPGDTIRTIINITNSTGKVLEVEELGNSYLAGLPETPSSKRAMQDKLWGETIKQLDISAVRLRLTTSQRGQFNFNRSFGPLTDRQANLIRQGQVVVYFTEIVRDADTHEPLLEFCSYIGRDKRTTMCYEHNQP